MNGFSMKNFRSVKVLVLFFGFFGLPLTAIAGDYPAWVMSPEYPGGIAAAECVTYSGSLSIDRQQAVADARVALAQQIEVRVKSVDKLYTERTTSGKSVQTKTNFQRASEQLTDRVLANSKVIKTEIIKNLIDTDKVCVMVALPSEATKEYFKEMVKVANVDVPARLENDLFEAFSKSSATP